jgi:hypothetical protein
MMEITNIALKLRSLTMRSPVNLHQQNYHILEDRALSIFTL